MTDEIRNEIALLRYAIIAPLVSGLHDDNQTIGSFFLTASQKKYNNYNGKLISFAPSTIKRWYYNYNKDGFDALIPQKRNDSGHSRKLDDDLKATIAYYKKELPRIPATLIYQKLVETGQITKSEISLSTITRYINQLKTSEKQTTHKHLLRYEREHINEVWYADTSVGFSLNVDGKKFKTHIIAFLDDKSRYITGCDVFFNDNFINVMSVMKKAVMKFGKTKVFSFDNGSSYKNKQMELLTARLGASLNYTAPYSPTSKGKCERWFKTMKQQWLSQLNPNNFDTLDELRLSLSEYVRQYNHTPHSSLNGVTPSDVFFSEPHLIKRLSDKQIHQAFLLEYERSVSADHVITIDKVLYEVPYHYAKQKIKLRYSPDLSHVYVVDKVSGELTEITLLNKHDNAHIKRDQFQFLGGDHS
jgi:transposase InsO family protein